MPEPVVIGEAPGRLDVLGGVADYSGSLVLETPIEGLTRVELRTTSEAYFRFVGEEAEEDCQIPLEAIDELLPLATVDRRKWLDDQKVPAFARYSFGCLLLLAETKKVHPECGFDFKISSTVPRSMGVSSSAALEVATLRALRDRFGVAFSGTELACLAQRAENEIVGAPCGLMDQLSSAHGEPGSLLPILCRPDELLEPVTLPEGVLAVGWPSGVQHDVGASPYATARAATFMGFEIFRRGLDQDWKHPSEIRPALFSRKASLVPETILGEDYATRFGEIPDPLSTLDPKREYHVRDSLSFPVHENVRAELAVHLLRETGAADYALNCLGESMYESHAGYTSIGLGCEETDRMVDLVDALGPKRGFYGARVSGGGSGGTVVVLMRTDAIKTLDEARQKLKVESARSTPFIYSAKAR